MFNNEGIFTRTVTVTMLQSCHHSYSMDSDLLLTRALKGFVGFLFFLQNSDKKKDCYRILPVRLGR